MFFTLAPLLMLATNIRYAADAVFPPVAADAASPADATDISFLSNYVATMSQQCCKNAKQMAISSNDDDKRKTVLIVVFRIESLFRRLLILLYVAFRF